MPNLIDEIDAFLTETKLSESQFGISAVNDKNLVPDLRNGRDMRMSNVARVREFMAAYSPTADAA